MANQKIFHSWHLLVWLSILTIYLSVNTPFSGVHFAAIRGLVNTGLLASLFYFYQWWLRRFPRPEASWVSWSVIFISVIVMTLLRTRINNLWLPGELHPFAETNRRVNLFWACLLSNFGMLSLSYLFFMNEHSRAAELTQIRLRDERRLAELQQLRSHINPHFLFNVLNNVYSLASVGSPRTAPTILELSGLLRYVTYEGQHDLVSLKEEIAQLRRYVALFSLRSERAMNISLDVCPYDEALAIEPLLLLPLVENAFKHGDFIANADAHAHFNLDIDDNQLIFTGHNSYDPAESSKDARGGVGLENIHQRIQLSYPGAALTTSADAEKGVFRFELVLPGIKKPPHD